MREDNTGEHERIIDNISYSAPIINHYISTEILRQKLYHSIPRTDFMVEKMRRAEGDSGTEHF